MQADEVLDDDLRGGGTGKRGGEDSNKDDDDDDDLDFIDVVAQANNAHVEAEDMLPVLRASPCTMHNRSLSHPHTYHPLHRPRGGLDLLYSTNCHGGQVKAATTAKVTKVTLETLNKEGLAAASQRCSKSDYTPRSLRERGAGRDPEDSGRRGRAKTKTGVQGWGSPAADTDPAKDRRRHLPKPAPVVVPPRLPGELPPSEVVRTWLKHGSAPAGESHFPDIASPQPEPANRVTPARRRHNQTALSE